MTRSRFRPFVLLLATATCFLTVGHAHAKEARVAILSIVRGYDPARVTVASGETVTWVNEDADNLHNAVCDASCPEAFASGPSAAKGSVGSHQFTKVGTYRYHCELHPNMVGDVVVTEAAATTTTSTTAPRATTTSSPGATTSTTAPAAASTTTTSEVPAIAPAPPDVEKVIDSLDERKESRTVPLVATGVLLATALLSYFATRAADRRR